MRDIVIELKHGISSRRKKFLQQTYWHRMPSCFLTINRSTTAEPNCTRAHFHTSGSNQIPPATNTIWRQWTVVLW